MSRGFTLVEILIVVAILGILAALVVPEFTQASQKAKEAAAKENLRMLRAAIERYALQNNDVAPGYPNNTSGSTSVVAFSKQILNQAHLLNTLPLNPFNSNGTIIIIQDTQPFPTQADGTSGYIYQPATKTIKLNQPGTDSTGTLYFDY